MENEVALKIALSGMKYFLLRKGAVISDQNLNLKMV